MKKIVFLCATFLLIVAGTSLDARTSGRIVMGNVTYHSSDGSTQGLYSTITFETQGEIPQTVETDWEGFYSTSVTSNKRYDCTCSNEFGSSSKVLNAGSQTASLNFDFY